MPAPIPVVDNLLLFTDDPKDLTMISIVAVDETRYTIFARAPEKTSVGGGASYIGSRLLAG